MIALLFVFLHGFLLQAQPYLPINILPWFGISFVVALVVILIAAALYMLAPVMNSTAMQDWSRFQIYEAILSIALILLFLAVVKLLFLNPQQGFGSIGLVPQGCNNPATVNTIYSLSTCDLAQFNTAGYTIADYLWAFSFIKGVLPSSTIAIQPTPEEGDGLEFNFQIPNILDAWNTTLLQYLLGAILLFMLISQIQLILLSGALLFMSFFFAIGLVSRVFGVSRSFGGAMIAFGIGIGIVYPLITAISYGFIDVSAHTACLTSLSASLVCPVESFGTAMWNTVTAPFSLFMTLANPATLAGVGAGPTGVTIGAASTLVTPSTILGAFATMFNEIGYILAGLTVIPVVNILIVDVFVIDFSRAVGEQMSFSMLFRSVI